MPIPCVSQLYRPFLTKGRADTTRIILPVEGWSVMKTPRAFGGIERHRSAGEASQARNRSNRKAQSALTALTTASHTYHPRKYEAGRIHRIQGREYGCCDIKYSIITRGRGHYTISSPCGREGYLPLSSELCELVCERPVMTTSWGGSSGVGTSEVTVTSS